MALGEHIEIGPLTRLIVGQELDIAVGQPDVCNVIVHRTGDLLVVVDTGATAVVRDAIRTLADELRPWSKVLLLTTHGHIDHVANNDLIHELGAGLDPADVRHYVSAHDAAQYPDGGLSYWTRSMSRVAGLVPGFDDPGTAARRLLSIFEPCIPVTDATRTFEELPLEHLRIGAQHLSGWSFADGAVQVIRSQGHTAGHVVVHLRDAGLLHLSDEPNGPCGAMHDANQLNIFAIAAQALTLVETGAVEFVTEGHAFVVYDRPAAAARLTNLLDQACAIDAAAQDLIDGSVEGMADFVRDFIAAMQKIGVSGANPNPMFFTMMATSKLRELGMLVTGEGAQQKWRRPSLMD